PYERAPRETVVEVVGLSETWTAFVVRENVARTARVPPERSGEEQPVIAAQLLSPSGLLAIRQPRRRHDRAASDRKDHDAKSPFDLTLFFCAAPLAVFRNTLYAGGQRGGTLYALDEMPAP